MIPGKHVFRAWTCDLALQPHAPPQHQNLLQLKTAKLLKRQVQASRSISHLVPVEMLCHRQNCCRHIWPVSV